MHYYAKFGFVNEGFRLHPRGVVWYQMRLKFWGTMRNGLRFAPAVFSGRIIFKESNAGASADAPHCIFTGGGVKVNGICRAAFCESAARRQTFRLNCKVTGFARGSPFEESLPPFRGKMSPQVTERARRLIGNSRKNKIPGTEVPGNLWEVTTRFELVDEGFADPCLTTWPRHHI